MYNGVKFYTSIYNYMNNTITKNLYDNTKYKAIHNCT